MPSMMPALWVYSTDGRYGAAPGSRWPGCFSKAQQLRLERLRQAKMLFEGRHREYFLDEDRSQFYFKPIRLSNGRIIRPYQKRNMLKLISLVSATLLLGQESLLRCQDKIQQGKIDDLKEKANLHSVWLSAAITCSWAAEVFLESQILDRQVYVSQIPGNEIFPVGAMLPNYQYRAYDRYQFTNVGGDGSQGGGTADRPIWLALITHLLPGQITRECWLCDGDSTSGPDKLVQPVSLATWKPDPTLPEVTRTGIAGNTVTYVPNLLQDGQAISDYDGVIDDQDKVNAKETQLGRVIAAAVDPKLAVDAAGADDQGNMDAAYDLHFRQRGATKDQDPAYITFEADLAAARSERDEAVLGILIETETSPVLVGFERGAAAESFDTVRLRAMPSINKAARKALLWRQGISVCLGTCLDLAQTIPGERFDRSPVEVTLRDGLPIDPLTQANVQSILKTAGLISLEAAVEERYGGDTEAAAIEIARIKANQAAATPTVIFHGEEEPNPAEAAPPGNGGDVASEAAGGGDEAGAESPENAALSGQSPGQKNIAGGYEA